MKKQLLMGTALSLGMAVLTAGAAFAEGIQVGTYAELKDCLESTESAICDVTADIAIEAPLTVTKGITLNLGGKKLSVDATKFTTGLGKGMITVNHGAELTINGEGTITTEDTEVNAAIRMTGETNDDEAAVLKVNDATLEGYYYAITGNGSAGRGNTIINLSKARVAGLNESDCFGIFHPQAGELNILDGTIIEGNTGLGVKSGTINLVEGTIHGTGALVEEPAPNGNGMNMSGAAIAAEFKSGYSDNVTINIKGGELLSDEGYAIHEYNDGTQAGIKNISIEGGEFNGAAGLFMVSELFTPDGPFISGGTFHIADNFDIFILITSMLPNCAITANPDMTEITISSKVITSENLPEGAETYIIYYDADYLESDESYMEMINEVLEAAGLTGKEVVYYMDISLDGLEDNHNLDAPVTFKVMIPEELRTPAEGFLRKWTVLREHSESAAAPDTYTELPATLDAETGELSFSSDKFSQFLVLYEDIELPKAPDTSIADELTASYIALGSLIALSAAAYATVKARR